MSDLGSADSFEKPSDIEKNPQGIVRRWVLELKLAEKREKDWHKKSVKVLDRYKQKDAKKHSFNILWSNTETLRPAVYNSLPKPDVRRRFKDDDPLGKAVSDVLGRALEFGLDTTDFNHEIEATVGDMLLPGRGIARVRYVPTLAQVGVTAETHEEGAEVHADGGEALEGDSEEVEWEQSTIEHVQWDDFRHGAGKEWGEVTWEGFRHRLTREELEEQFGEIGAKIKLDSTDDEEIEKERDVTVADSFKTAEVWEIWDKDKREVIFIAPTHKDEPLKTIPDPLRLQAFFPTPRPLYATEDSTTLIPVPLYELYKEQAEELDVISGRINKLVKGLKLRGIYDSTLTELSELMRGEDNELFPAANVTALLERGGLEKAIWFMPIEQAANVLKVLYEQREATKGVIYEITGIADILRGETNPNETLGAQQIKDKWGSMRLRRMQGEVSRFIRDLIRLQAEIIGEHFSLDTLKTMTGVKLPTLQEKQQVMIQAQMSQQQPPELPPAWEEVMQVLKDDKQRTFKIDVETDSTIAASVEGDMQGLREVLGGVTELMNGLGPAVQMGALPVEALKELILAVTRRAKLGNAVEDALDKMKAPPPPPQEQQPQDHSLEVAQIRQQGETAKLQQDGQIEQMKLQAEGQRHAVELQHKAEIERMTAEKDAAIEQAKLVYQAKCDADKLAFEQWKVEFVEGNKLAIAQLGADTTMKTSAMSASTDEVEVGEDGSRKPATGLQALVESMNENMEKLLQTHQESHKEIVAVLSKPKKVVRDLGGRMTGVA